MQANLNRGMPRSVLAARYATFLPSISGIEMGYPWRGERFAVMDANAKILTSAERKTLAAIADRIFPKTETPGAVEIGAVDYIEIALNGDYAALLSLYRAGLRALNRHAKIRF